MDLNALFTVPIGDLILWFVVFLFSLSFHEMAHALTSEWFGDDTGRLQGRISLNPIAHIHPIGTILFPLLGFMQGGFLFFGWAKPVETNPLRWRNKDVANISVSAAGPISNMILATIAFVALKAMLLSGNYLPAYRGGPFDLVMPASGMPDWALPVGTLVSIMLLTNISLAVFNLIPIPPLDGSHVLYTLLPESLKDTYSQLSQFGFILLIALSVMGVFGAIVGPVMGFVISLL
ncbi:MAG: site-2 protease family protein [Blastocatellales bacterium]